MKYRTTQAGLEQRLGGLAELGAASHPRRFVLKTKSTLRSGLRLLPAALLLATVVTTAPAAGATGCTPSGSTVIASGGNSRNETNLDITADGGIAVANADGGDDNVAIAILGLAEAGNGGEADANANGGMIEIGDINSGNNTGNVLNVRNTGGDGCGGGGGTGGGNRNRTGGGGGGGGSTIVSGGNSSNETNIDLSADGGIAVANANGGDDNVAVGVLGSA
jgi:hypothetical protein